jgi:metallophosphoesterase (TIGR00282 family)
MSHLEGRQLDILFIGDVVGRPGRDVLTRALARMRVTGFPDLVIANGENAAGGFGLTRDVYHELLNAGVQVLTMGNHTWDKRDIFDFIGESDHLVRPINYPEGTPGRGYTVVEAGGHLVGIVNVMGRVFMPTLDCPFRTVERAIEDIVSETRVILVDIHAEATAEKMALAHHLDGRVSAVFGTHTHVQTADECILPGGTGYLTDAGMTGPYRSIIGMQSDLAVKKMMTQLPTRLEVAEGPAQFNAVRITVEVRTGRTLTIERLNFREN